MIQRALDENGAWLFGKGLNSYVRGIDAVMLNIRSRILLWRGDSFSHPTEGVDYLSLLRYNPGNALEYAIKRVILTSEGVLRITSFDADFDSERRHLRVEAVVETVYGQGELDVQGTVEV